MAKISAELRKKLRKQREEMSFGSGIIIPSKGFKKARVRLLPIGTDLPGKLVQRYHCDQLEKKNATSPVTFGLRCPIEDFYNHRCKGKSKEEMKALREIVQRNREYWVPVILRGDEQDVENPTIRILPARQTVYETIQDSLEDEDYGEDITDPKEGRDLLVKKTGQGLETQWSCTRLEPTPLHESPKMQKAILAAWEKFDLDDHIYPVDWEVIEQMYEALTGEDMPDEYRKTSSSSGTKKKKRRPVEDEEEDEVEEVEEDEEEESSGEIEIGSTVSFEDEGEVYTGTLVDTFEGDDGEEYAKIEVGDEEWEFPLDEVSLAEDEEEDEEVEEDDEAEEEDEDVDEDDEAEEEDEDVDEDDEAEEDVDEDEEAEEEEEVEEKPRPRSVKKPTAKKTATKKKVTKKPTAKKAPPKKTATKKAPPKKTVGKKTGKKTASKAIRSRMKGR